MTVYTFINIFNRRPIKEALIISILALVLGFSFNAVRPNRMELFVTYEISDSEQMIEKISVEKASALLESSRVVFLDLRSADNFHSAHIPGALNFPFENIYEKLSELDSFLNNKDVEIIIYGNDLMDTKPGDLAEMISMMGHENIKILTGGWASWESKIFPVTTHQNSKK